MKKISDFSTSVIWRNVKLIHTWRNFRFLHILYRNLKFLHVTDFFLHGHRPPCPRQISGMSLHRLNRLHSLHSLQSLYSLYSLHSLHSFTSFASASSGRLSSIFILWLPLLPLTKFFQGLVFCQPDRKSPFFLYTMIKLPKVWQPKKIAKPWP